VSASSAAAAASRAEVQADAVSGAAEQVSRNVESAAAGADQMGASIREISQSASDAAGVAADAVRVARETTRTVHELSTSSEEIGAVLAVITAIAQQTNLLALNATIEAARAGDAGRGFAVVAGEVKDLAQETSRATEDIGRRVQAIQASASSTAEAIDRIQSVVGRIDDHQHTIASAVEEQTAVTNEMARSVSDAAEGSRQIAGSTAGVVLAARSASTGVGEAHRSAEELRTMSAELSALVGRFTL